jgi:hypothetical protein
MNLVDLLKAAERIQFERERELLATLAETRQQMRDRLLRLADQEHRLWGLLSEMPMGSRAYRRYSKLNSSTMRRSGALLARLGRANPF